MKITIEQRQLNATESLNEFIGNIFGKKVGDKKTIEVNYTPEVHEFVAMKNWEGDGIRLSWRPF